MDSAAQPVPGSPVPGEDDFVSLAFVNTRFDRPAGPHEALSTAPAARAWLHDRGLLPADAPLGERRLHLLRSMRDWLRALFEAHISGTPPAAETLDRFNAALAASPATLGLQWPATGPKQTTGSRPGDALTQALARLAEDVMTLLTGPEAAKLASCAAPGCTRVFLRSHAARRWCSDRCGNRVRVARHAGRTRT
ncbi:CGNR zinc finger domain-containing protein [Nonomuraea sp. KM88]|uniref:CGNR zinc finger domain-containing protein n=1 Tax=Nonomuraea sp. KM88 TaxID=3457427 RepID=UPI003FCC627E